ncbi:MAG: nucleotide exchange factor GrpE [candidate division WOR-3 bacterium]|nr:nucleotide exchange factor GrpE [candidate division WOR-3 bacterium]
MTKKGPVSELKEKLETLSAEAKTHYENYLRLLAEFENFRKRKEREIDEFRLYANENLMTELIPVLENFDRALACKDLAVANNKESLQKGLEIVYRQLKSILEKFGLKEFSMQGQEFNPKTCEAISFIETNEKPTNTVVEEIGKGYLYYDRVIRPAKVIVAIPKKEDNKQKSDKDKENNLA